MSLIKFLPDLISAQRKENSTNRVLLRLIGNWKTTLDGNLFTGAVLIDLSKAFDCIPQETVIAKLHDHGLSFMFQTHIFLKSYLTFAPTFLKFCYVYHKAVY